MNILAMGKNALTARRDVIDIQAAMKGRNRAALAGAFASALMFVIGILKGSKYAAYVEWITPELALQAGSVGAAALFGIGHWSAGGIVAAAVAPVAGTPGDAPARQQGPLAAPVGSSAAQPPAALGVRLQPGAPDNPNNYLPG